MYNLTILTAIICLLKFVSAEDGQPKHFYPTQYRAVPIESGPYPVLHRSVISVPETFADDGYEYTVISKEEYPLVEQDSINTAVYNLLTLSDPITGLSVIGSNALNLVKFLIPKAALIFLGMAILFGICAFTPFCTLTIESPFEIKIPYVDSMENLFNAAYAKYENMQFFK